jgi:ParB-like chromosome segregation protein Spo0J
MKYNHGMIRLSDINFEDRSFQITTREDTEDLAGSIKAMGLINAPILWQAGSGPWIIVCGRRRIQACLDIGWVGMQARLAEKKTPRLVCIQTAISDNAFQRPLNWVEISRALNLLMEEIPDKEQIKQVLPDLGLPEGGGILEKAVPIAHLPRPIQEGLISGHIPFAMALELGNLEPETGSFMANLFQQLTLSLNKQREILEWTQEIGARESRSFMDIFREAEIREIIANPDRDRNQKSAALRKYLRTRRYPSIQKAETLYQDNLKSLKIPSGVRLVPPKDFESDVYGFALEFRSTDQLASRLKTLESLSEAKALKDLLSGVTIDEEQGLHPKSSGIKTE